MTECNPYARTGLTQLGDFGDMIEWRFATRIVIDLNYVVLVSAHSTSLAPVEHLEQCLSILL